FVDRLIKQWQVPVDRQVSQCSPGEVQKIGSVLALGHRPKLLLLDEPAASLDPVSRRQLLSELVELASGDGQTIFFSTHIVSDLERIADRVVILKNGSVLIDQQLDTLKETVVRITVDCPPAANLDLLPRSIWNVKVA